MKQMKRKLTALAAALALCAGLVAPGFGARTYETAWLERDATLEEAGYVTDPLTAVNHGGKWGYVDREGRMVVAAQYEYALEYAQGLAAVSKGGKSGYIDAAGKTVIALEYEDAASFSEGLTDSSTRAGPW